MILNLMIHTWLSGKDHMVIVQISIQYILSVGSSMSYGKPVSYDCIKYVRPILSLSTSTTHNIED